MRKFLKSWSFYRHILIYHALSTSSSAFNFHNTFLTISFSRHLLFFLNVFVIFLKTLLFLFHAYTVPPFTFYCLYYAKKQSYFFAIVFMTVFGHFCCDFTPFYEKISNLYTFSPPNLQKNPPQCGFFLYNKICNFSADSSGIPQGSLYGHTAGTGGNHARTVDKRTGTGDAPDQPEYPGECRRRIR